MTRRLLPVAAVVVVLGGPAVVGGHHSQSEYDLRGKVEVTGVVTKLDWRSPHAWVYVDVINDRGETVNWSFELPSPTTLMRRGWTRESLKAGDRIKVTGAPARNFPAIAIANFITDSSGKPMFTGTTQVYDPAAPVK